MKKLFMCLLVAGAFTTVATAQDSTANGAGKMEKMHGMQDCVMMKDGKVMVMKGGQVTPLQSDINLTNGTTVSTSGSVKTADGTTMILKEGDMLGMDGKMMMKKDKMKKDSMK